MEENLNKEKYTHVVFKQEIVEDFKNLNMGIKFSKYVNYLVKTDLLARKTNTQ